MVQSPVSRIQLLITILRKWSAWLHLVCGSLKLRLPGIKNILVAFISYSWYLLLFKAVFGNVFLSFQQPMFFNFKTLKNCCTISRPQWILRILKARKLMMKALNFKIITRGFLEIKYCSQLTHITSFGGPCCSILDYDRAKIKGNSFGRLCNIDWVT